MPAGSSTARPRGRSADGTGPRGPAWLDRLARRLGRGRADGPKRSPVPVGLALQGGGAHGAFTWGVLDRLLEDGRIEPFAVSGTSAGAVNAAALAQGLAEGGREGGRAKLAEIWTRIGEAAGCGLIPPSPLGDWPFQPQFGVAAMEILTRLASPYDFNPLNLNPLRDVLERTLDFELIRCGPVRLFVAATHVPTGRARIFGTSELSVDAVLASTCLPWLFQAVEIEGEAYWDGGFVANPPIWPLVGAGRSGDLIIVQINPRQVEAVPKTPRAIIDRVNEVSFNASLLNELRALRRAGPEGGPRLHLIDSGGTLDRFGASTRLKAEPAFFRELFGLGRDAAGSWLERTGDALGRKSSLDVVSLDRSADHDVVADAGETSLGRRPWPLRS